MTKKHFKVIAEILKKHDSDYPIINDFMEYFKTVNPNFDGEKFLRACGIN